MLEIYSKEDNSSKDGILLNIGESQEETLSYKRIKREHSLLKWFLYDVKNLCMYKRLQKRPAQKQNYAYETYRRSINGHSFLSKRKVNEIIAEKILLKEPFWVGRMGYTEMAMIRHVIEYDMLPSKDYRQTYVDDLCKLSGFFPNSVDLASDFGHMMLGCSKNIDMQGFWDLYMEDYVLSEYQESTSYITTLDALEPWNLFFENIDKKEELFVNSDEAMVRPWSYALRGKKVLVIHPFAESIYSQYADNKDRIFERIYKSEDILPDFELKVIKAVQTLGNTKDDRFETWFDALEYMKKQCEKEDFDVAIIGCGAYGYPLANHVKKMGKVAIHLGGATQLMFGIMGNRWETTHKEVGEKIANDYWIRPRNSEKFATSKDVEEGCYW